MKQNKKAIIGKIRAFNDTRIFGLLAFGVVAILVTWSGIKVVQTNYELEKKISISRQRNSVEQLENQNLKLKNKYFETSQYLELTARRQFGKAAPGERLYTVPEKVAFASTIEPLNVTQSLEQPEAKKSKFHQNFSDWMNFLFKQ